MSTDPLKYKPLLWSETLLSVLPGQPPFLGCGVSSAAHGLDLATGGEFATLPDGRRKGKAARTNDLKVGWRAFLKVADTNGIPDTDDYIRIHRAMAPEGTPDPVQLKTRDWSAVTAALDEDFAISIAVRLLAVAGTSAARWTTADHQMVIWKRTANGKTKRIDPMHPHSDRYSGDWIDLADVRKAAKAIEGGLILGWLYPIGGWTAEALAAQRRQKAMRALRAEVAEKDKTIERIRGVRDALKVTNAELRAALAACEADPEPPDDIRNDIIDELIAKLEDMRP